MLSLFRKAWLHVLSDSASHAEFEDALICLRDGAQKPRPGDDGIGNYTVS